jgi:hypothetical protein
VRRALSLLALLGVAALVAVLVNVVLLNTASGNDPVGKLSPRAGLPAPPAKVIRPYTGAVEHDDNDD